MNHFISTVIIFSLGGVSSAAIASHLQEEAEEKRFRPIPMRSGFALTHDMEEQVQGRTLRNTMMKAALSEEFVDTYRRAFTYHFTHTVDPLTASFIPEDIMKVVPPAMINAADILGKFKSDHKDTVVGHVLPHVDEANIDYKHMSLGFLRLALIIKDAPEFSGRSLKPARDHLMKIAFLKAAEIAESIVPFAEAAEKTDAHSSIGQLFRWAGARVNDNVERDLYYEKATHHFSEARQHLGFIEEPTVRQEFESKISTELAALSLEKFLPIFATLALHVAEKSEEPKENNDAHRNFVRSA